MIIILVIEYLSIVTNESSHWGNYNVSLFINIFSNLRLRYYSSFSQELEFLPLFIMLGHVALFWTKIVVTHITICGIVLQLFAAAWTSYWHIQCYYQLSVYLRSIESLLLWYTPLFEDNWICVKYNSHKLLTFLKHEIFSFSQKVETCIRMINFTKFANFELISFKISVTL